MKLSEFLKTIRELKGLTLRAVEELTEGQISNSYLSQIESGKIAEPSYKFIRVLAMAYGLDPVELLRKSFEWAAYDNPIHLETLASLKPAFLAGDDTVKSVDEG